MISIGSDHRGFELKKKIIENFKEFKFIDVGADSSERSDYPVFAKKVCKNILDGKADLGILICGSGVGMSIAANRFKKIYAALCWNAEVAMNAKVDDGANVLVLPADYVSTQDAFEIFKIWVANVFQGGIYQKRLDMIDTE